MKKFQVLQSRCWCHPLVLVAAIFLQFFPYITTTVNNSSEEIVDFWAINTLPDGEIETRIYYQGIIGREITVDPRSIDDIKFRQLTNNQTLIQLIYLGGELKDCEIVHSKNQVLKFLKQFKTDLNRLITTSNFTVESLDDTQLLPNDFKWLDFHIVKRSCRHLHKELKAKIQSPARSRRDLSDLLRVPGTKWCGKGYAADKYTRLGGFSRTDKCCRRHDMGCPFWIGAFETKYGLFNWRVNTIMHCSCDERFRTCLKMVDTSDSNLVGKLFFNYVQSKCFVLKPKKRCLRTTWWGTCEKFKYEKQAIIRDNLPY